MKKLSFSLVLLCIVFLKANAVFSDYRAIEIDRQESFFHELRIRTGVWIAEVKNPGKTITDTFNLNKNDNPTIEKSNEENFNVSYKNVILMIFLLIPVGWILFFKMKVGRK